MAYVTIPKDLSRIQSKVLFGLTKRKVICFGAAALCMILVMLPFFPVRHVREKWAAAGNVPGRSGPE